jgi:hypothetical protein
MNAPSMVARLVSPFDPRTLWREVRAREHRLAWFGLGMLLLMLPTLLALGLDLRTLRGVSVWVKPLKFMASLALFAGSTAWFVGLLPHAERRGRAVDTIVWIIVGAGTFEIGYVVLQAALGHASHYNFSDALHLWLYNLMGLAALAMTATQALLAWRIARTTSAAARGVWRQGVITGLVMTFVMGAGAGGLLGGLQPPAGAGLPIFGWQFGGDLRPAHFVGMHAQQVVPLVAWALAALPAARGRRTLAAFSAAYALLWIGAVAVGLNGAQPTPPPPYDGSGR